VGKPHKIALELDCAMPRLEGEGRALHVPEIRPEERRIELVGDAALAEHHLGLDRQAFQAQDVLLREAELGSVQSMSATEESGLG